MSTATLERSPLKAGNIYGFPGSKFWFVVNCVEFRGHPGYDGGAQGVSVSFCNDRRSGFQLCQSEAHFWDFMAFQGAVDASPEVAAAAKAVMFRKKPCWALLNWPDDQPAIFVPQKRVHFADTKSGVKRFEYRKLGKIWNEKSCRVGRRIIFSNGYGIQNRLTGRITSFRIEHNPHTLPGWTDCYGDDNGPAAVIGFEITGELEVVS